MSRSSRSTVESHHVAIIGAGPIGIELAVALKQAGIDYVQFDASQIGSTIQWYPLEMLFHSSADRLSISGVPLQVPDQQKPKREEYLNYLRSVVVQFGLEIRTHERVVGALSLGRGGVPPPAAGRPRPADGVSARWPPQVSPAHPAGEDAHRQAAGRRPSEGFELTTQTVEGEQRVRAENVVVAIGAMHAPRLLGIPGEDAPNVSHYFRDPHDYFGKRLLVVGGRNSAVETAVRCQRVGAIVTVSYRKSDFDSNVIKFWLLPEIRSMLRDGRVKFLPRTLPVEIRGHSVLLAPTAADGQPLPGGIPEEVAADFVLLMTGYQQDTSIFSMLGVDLQGIDRQPKYDPETMETNVAGVFVAGTAIAGTPPGKVRVIVESCHGHVPRIVGAITGQRLAPAIPAVEDD